MNSYIAHILQEMSQHEDSIILYSPIWGECELHSVDLDRKYPIKVVVRGGENDAPFIVYFYADGTYHRGGECMLFPSKDNRDWVAFARGQQPSEECPYTVPQRPGTYTDTYTYTDYPRFPWTSTTTIHFK